MCGILCSSARVVAQLATIQTKNCYFATFYLYWFDCWLSTTYTTTFIQNVYEKHYIRSDSRSLRTWIKLFKNEFKRNTKVAPTHGYNGFIDSFWIIWLTFMYVRLGMESILLISVECHRCITIVRQLAIITNKNGKWARHILNENRLTDKNQFQKTKYWPYGINLDPIEKREGNGAIGFFVHWLNCRLFSNRIAVCEKLIFVEIQFNLSASCKWRVEGFNHMSMWLVIDWLVQVRWAILYVYINWP